ncbi:hypothetical protein [Flintibacter muris]|uniref:hypothetical protein n=1 Tax=Flintibacter muris TaxID=2941327 RepID=UPI002040863A|nr:hypothetical protein [Flintibacter muris]
MASKTILGYIISNPFSKGKPILQYFGFLANLFVWSLKYFSVLSGIFCCFQYKNPLFYSLKGNLQQASKLPNRICRGGLWPPAEANGSVYGRRAVTGAPADGSKSDACVKRTGKGF